MKSEEKTLVESLNQKQNEIHELETEIQQLRVKYSDELDVKNEDLKAIVASK